MPLPKMLRLFRIAWRLLLFAALGGVAALLVLVIYLAAARGQPLALPAPTGLYPVGRVTADWVDESRPDPPAPRRELAVWIWYPAQPEMDQAPVPYLPPDWAAARNRDQGIGILLERDLAKIQTHSYTGAALAAAPARFPLLIMQPGMGPAVPDYTALAENLASHGYIVVGLNPTYTANLVTFTDGRVVLRSAQGTIPDSAGPVEADATANRIMAVWAADVRFAFDRLSALDQDPGSLFYRRLDLDHTGVFGHSFGGATAILVCQQDARCKAGADLDGTPFSAEAGRAIPAPFMFMTEDYTAGCDTNCAAIRRMAKFGPPGQTFLLSVRGANHFNFSDLPLRWLPAVRPLFAALGYLGPIDPARGLQVANDTLLAFFDQALKGSQAGQLGRSSPEYPEVIWEQP